MSTARPPQPRPGRHRGDQPAARPGPDDAAVERLLRGDPVRDPGAARLVRVLNAAAAPATSDELCHLDTVCTAYAAHARRPRRGGTVRPGRTSVPQLGLKLSVAVATATAVGGVAFAASAGILPTPAGRHPASANPSQAGPPSRSGASTAPAPSAATVADLAALCDAYLATGPSERDSALAGPGFDPLVTAAGGAENVSRYCADTADDRSPAPRVTPSRHQTGKPSAQPSRPPTGTQSTPSPARRAR